MERPIRSAYGKLRDILRADGRIPVGGDQCLRDVVRGHLVAVEKTRAVDHGQPLDVNPARDELLAEDFETPPRATRCLRLRTHDLDQHLGGEVVAPFANRVEKPAQLSRRHVGEDRQPFHDVRILDGKHAAHSNLAERAHPEAGRMGARIGDAPTIVQGPRRRRHLPTHLDREVAVFGGFVVDLNLGWPARFGGGVVFDLDVTLGKDAYPGWCPDSTPGSDVNDIAVVIN